MVFIIIAATGMLILLALLVWAGPVQEYDRDG